MAEKNEPQDVKTTAMESRGPGAEKTRGEAYATPPVDIFERDGSLVIVADVPGVSQDGLEVNLENGVLEITAHRKDGFKQEEADYSEYVPTSYYRAFSLSDEIDAENISATLKNGVLQVTLPKSAKARPRKIEVKAG